VSAEAINNSGILLIANYRLGGEASSFGAIPSEVLISLSAPAVGGVRGPNPSDVPFVADRLLAHSVEPQIRLMNLNQPSIRSAPELESQRVTPTEQGSLFRPRTSFSSLTEVTRQSGSALSVLLRSFTHLEGAWSRALDNLFTNGPWQGPLSDWWQRLPSSSPVAIEGEDMPPSPTESAEGLETTLLNSSGDAHQPWASAGLLLGVGAVLGADVKKQRRASPRSPCETRLSRNESAFGKTDAK
jgi:hypothetical protein